MANSSASAISVILATDRKLQLSEDVITCRASDGYVNLTELCHAGGKAFGDWKKNKKSIAFLQALSDVMNIIISKLIVFQTGRGSDQITWGHPRVAINICQWISPKFDAQVSGWIYELIVTRKVDLDEKKTDEEIDRVWQAKCELFEKANNELQEEKEKLQEEKNRLLGETEELKTQISNLQSIRPFKRRPRPKFPKGFFLYFATTRLFFADKEIKIGKTDDLRKLYSAYNRLSKTVFIYYRHCGDKQNMDSAETIIFKHLREYRRYENGEKFLLKDKDISFFIDKANETIDYITETKEQGEICLDNLNDLNVEDDFEEEDKEPDEEKENSNFMKQVNKELRTVSNKNDELTTEISEIKYRMVYNECSFYPLNRLREVCQEFQVPVPARCKKAELARRLKAFILEANQDIAQAEKDRKINKCKECGVVITKVSERCRSCEYVARGNRHPNKPTRETLLEELKSNTYPTLAKKYGVCVMTIRRWKVREPPLNALSASSP